MIFEDRIHYWTRSLHVYRIIYEWGERALLEFDKKTMLVNIAEVRRRETIILNRNRKFTLRIQCLGIPQADIVLQEATHGADDGC